LPGPSARARRRCGAATIGPPAPLDAAAGSLLALGATATRFETGALGDGAGGSVGVGGGGAVAAGSSGAFAAGATAAGRANTTGAAAGACVATTGGAAGGKGIGVAGAVYVGWWYGIVWNIGGGTVLGIIACCMYGLACMYG